MPVTCLRKACVRPPEVAKIKIKIKIKINSNSNSNSNSNAATAQYSFALLFPLTVPVGDSA
ncbi:MULTISPECIES: hypothetical protein [Pseudomonas]|uniref:hypothetical protein n=1 Tax=Pseudomonas TaxID=286 RepID=UPI0012FEE6CF|nr:MULTISPECIES: hypothetical protein [Pseudomonas]EKT4471484.1 hypothetical protein [Pseudomonas putida]EKT4513557.1 hypothetical protein [Pseudomonas putida]